MLRGRNLPLVDRSRDGQLAITTDKEIIAKGIYGTSGIDERVFALKPEERFAFEIVNVWIDRVDLGEKTLRFSAKTVQDSQKISTIIKPKLWYYLNGRVRQMARSGRRTSSGLGGSSVSACATCDVAFRGSLL